MTNEQFPLMQTLTQETHFPGMGWGWRGRKRVTDANKKKKNERHLSCCTVVNPPHRMSNTVGEE